MDQPDLHSKFQDSQGYTERLCLTRDTERDRDTERQRETLITNGNKVPERDFLGAATWGSLFWGIPAGQSRLERAQRF